MYVYYVTQFLENLQVLVTLLSTGPFLALLPEELGCLVIGGGRCNLLWFAVAEVQSAYTFQFRVQGGKQCGLCTTLGSLQKWPQERS